MLAAQGEGAAAQAEALAAVLGRIDARDAQLEAQAAMLAALGRRLERLVETAGDPGAFQETLGLTLAEFLARIEARGARAEPARALS